MRQSGKLKMESWHDTDADEVRALHGIFIFMSIKKHQGGMQCTTSWATRP